MLERTLNERFPGTALDHLDAVRNRQFISGASISNDAGQSYNYDYLAGASPDTERIWQWQAPQTPTLQSGRINSQPQGEQLSTSQPSSRNALSSTASGNSAALGFQESSAKPEGVDDIPTGTAASFFRTYFQAIHPQYPFLSVTDCGNWYQEWKLAPAGHPISGWPAFFVKMVDPMSLFLPAAKQESRSLQLGHLSSTSTNENTFCLFVSKEPKSSETSREEKVLAHPMSSSAPIVTVKCCTNSSIDPSQTLHQDISIRI